MKTLVILCLPLCLLFSVSAPLHSQPTIRYGQAYTLTDTATHCIVQLTVIRKPKLQATLLVNKQRYTGYLSENRNNKETVYNFYLSIGGRKQLLMFQFRKEEGNNCYGVTIINQEYAAVFKPCPDEKYIKLQSCE